MTQKSFSVGDSVLVKSVKKVGQITAVLRGVKCRVSLGAVSLVVNQSDLEHASPSSENTPKSVVFPSGPKRTSVPTTIDLHGFTVEDAVRRLEAWLNDCIIAGHGAVKIVHGLGTGKIQRASHETLKRYSSVRAFRINDLNPGETDVYIG